uniref:Hypoxia up-regulated protein 1 n=1 Tax=Steinernema glaseri TaxID=37863 RepID=A0A1I8AM22_9BILA
MLLECGSLATIDTVCRRDDVDSMLIALVMNLHGVLLLSAAVLFSLFSAGDGALAAMSIDLGSQFIKIGLVKPGVPMEIVLNKESRRKTPAIVSFKSGERLFSDAAAALSVKTPKTTYTHILDLIGKKADNPIVQLHRERFPHLAAVIDDNRGTLSFPVDDATYNVETLLAMILWNVRQITEEYAQQPVRDAVITIPVYFNQAERKALTKAAQMAGLNLLQLLTDGSAAGLNYGVFRRKEITEQAQTLLIYDVGASKTTATILEYRLAKEKNSNEKNPVMSTLGVGYDRTLGGLELTVRMQKHLVEEFKKMKKTKKEITENPRAMAKMLKEAERVKQVLSANVDHFAQIENVFDEQDFRVKVTREQLHEMMADLEPRFIQTITDALKMAEMTVDQIDQVVLMGAGTRIPRVQALLQDFFKGKELGRFLNTDEAIALGAVYQAAHLSKGFKVKKFAVQELQIHPIQIDFTSFVGEHREEKKMTRTLFGYKSHYPTNKKIISFTSHTKDFSFNVNYGSLSHLNPTQLSELGSLNLTDVHVQGVTEAIEKEGSDPSSEFKGTKAYFFIDNSGIVNIDKIELVYERPSKIESVVNSIADKISGFFGSDEGKENVEEQSNEDAAKESEQAENDEQKKSTKEPHKEDKEKSEEAGKKEKESTNEGAEKPKSGESTEGTNNTESPKKAEPEKPKVVKITLKTENVHRDVVGLSDSETKSAIQRLADFEKAEKAKAERDAAHNTLEALLYDLSDKLEGDEFSQYATEEEKLAARAELDKVRAWLEDEVTFETTTEEFKGNKKALDAAVKQIRFRRKQQKERPKVVADLLALFNHTETFHALSQNLTEVFTETELSTLEKKLTETKSWWAEKSSEQEKLAVNQDPAMTIGDIKDKIKELDRELKYLLTKMKYHKPKTTKKEKEPQTGNETEGAGDDATAKDEEKPASEESSGKTEEEQPKKEAEEAATAEEPTATEKEQRGHDGEL